MTPKVKLNLWALGTVLSMAATLFCFERQIRETVKQEAAETADKAWERVADKVPDGIPEVG